MQLALLCFLGLVSIRLIGAFNLPLRELSSAANFLNFFTLGDWGSVNDDQKNVAVAIGSWASSEHPFFLFSLGDNFYEDGVSSDTDPQWTTTYAYVYTNPALVVPWYALLGNHDHHMGRGQGQIDFYLNKRDTRWFFPNWWYSATWAAATSDGQRFTIKGIFIDTVLLVGGDDSGVNETQVQEQTDWITSELQSSTADWLFVSGHYPVYSAGEHGNTAQLIDLFEPLFNQYQVDVYFCGHDHTLQHLQSGNVNYFVSGNGAKRGSYAPIPQSKFGVVDPGFGVHFINSTHLTTKLVDYNSEIVYTYTQARNKKRWEDMQAVY